MNPNFYPLFTRLRHSNIGLQLKGSQDALKVYVSGTPFSSWPVYRSYEGRERPAECFNIGGYKRNWLFLRVQLHHIWNPPERTFTSSDNMRLYCVIDEVQFTATEHTIPCCSTNDTIPRSILRPLIQTLTPGPNFFLQAQDSLYPSRKNRGIVSLADYQICQLLYTYSS